MQIPPKHRHDETSPLPLGMDWSPPPRTWNGRDTVWPHDPRTGWSYCVIVPSWIVRPKTRDSDSVVFYRVQVGIQSPDGITTSRGVLRRFNDFLKLFSLLKKAFPDKDMPPAPPKGLLKLKNRVLLEERRSSLEGWIMKLLSDIELSRSAPVASFLELEAAARSSFQNENQHTMEMSPDRGDTACKTSAESPICERDNNSEIGMEAQSLEGGEVGNPMEKFVKYGVSNIDEGLLMGHAILKQIEGFQKHHKTHFSSDIGHSRNLSNESDVSSARSTEFPTSLFRNSNGDGNLVNCGGNGVFESSSFELLLPIDQRQKMNGILLSMQRRLLTAKTDMEDLITRLNQEIIVNDYLVTKVNDLEVELEATKQRSKESLQQTILIERERVTQMQWDMEELRQKSFKLESKLKSQQGDSLDGEYTNESVSQEREILPKDKETESSAHEKDNEVILQELELTKMKLEDLLTRHEELQMKSKADIKVLIREVKYLRNSQKELNQEVSNLLKEKSVSQELLEMEEQKKLQINRERRNLLSECKVLVHRNLLECTLPDEEDKLLVNGSSDLNLLDSSDHQIWSLLAKVQSFTESDEVWSDEEDETRAVDRKLKRMLANMLCDNVKLRKEISTSTTSHNEKNVTDPKQDNVKQRKREMNK